MKLNFKELKLSQVLKNIALESLIYLNILLPPNTHSLLKKARVVARFKNYEYVRVRSGTVLVRKDDNSSALLIYIIQDLHQLP